MKTRLLTIFLSICFITVLPGCGGGTVGSDRSGSTGGYEKSITVGVSGMVVDENGNAVSGLFVNASRGNESTAEDYTDEQGYFELQEAKTDNERNLTLNVGRADGIQRQLPEDSKTVRTLIAYQDDMEIVTATPLEFDVSTESKSKKKDKKDEQQPNTEAVDQFSLEQALESSDDNVQQTSTSSENSGGSSQPNNEPSTPEEQQLEQDVEDLVDGADLGIME